jgi:hypothetical protein
MTGEKLEIGNWNVFRQFERLEERELYGLTDRKSLQAILEISSLRTLNMLDHETFCDQLSPDI